MKTMKKQYIKPEEMVIAIKTNNMLLTISGETPGNAVKDGEDYSRGFSFFDDDDSEDEY